MSRLSELKEKKKLDNNGFSLVELIIVIAIMAVLIGVLALQYLKYVERSRNSTDQDNATAIASALQVWASETDYGSKKPYTADTGVVTVKASGGSVTAELNTSAVQDALDNASINISNLKCQSKTKWVEYMVSVDVNSDGSANTSITYKDSTEAAVTL